MENPPPPVDREELNEPLELCAAPLLLDERLELPELLFEELPDRLLELLEPLREELLKRLPELLEPLLLGRGAGSNSRRWRITSFATCEKDSSPAMKPATNASKFRPQE